jgi:hypothetical protein
LGWCPSCIPSALWEWPRGQPADSSGLHRRSSDETELWLSSDRARKPLRCNLPLVSPCTSCPVSVQTPRLLSSFSESDFSQFCEKDILHHALLAREVVSKDTAGHGCSDGCRQEVVAVIRRQIWQSLLELRAERAEVCAWSMHER